MAEVEEAEATAESNGKVPLISPSAIDFYEASFVGLASKRFKERTGIDRLTIKRFRMGYMGTRIGKGKPGYFLPVQDPDGTYRTARFVDEETHAGRWVSTTFPRITCVDHENRPLGLHDHFKNQYETLFLVGNEVDFLALSEILHGTGYGVLGVLDGKFPEEWCAFIRNRNVHVMLAGDPDSSALVARILKPLFEGMQDRGELKSLNFITLQGESGQSAGVVDWKRAGGDLPALERIISGGAIIPKDAEPTRPDAKPVELLSFALIDDPRFTDRRVRVPLCITGETSNVYDSPFRFKADSCPEIARFDQKTGEGCIQCKDRIYTIEIGQPAHIAAFRSSEHQRDRICREHIHCPLNKKPRIDVLEKATLREVIASQYSERMVEREENDGGTSLDGRKERLTERPVYIAVQRGTIDAVEPRGYHATGWIRTSPRDATRTLLVERLDPIQEPHELFDFRKHIDTLKRMKGFGYRQILEDLTEHCTMIFGSEGLLLVVMLTYCSALHFRFNGEMIRGWLTSCLLGDTGVGKSKVFEAISNKIGVGDIFSCLTGRRTGLTYATVRTATHWSVQAGLMPRNSRKILCVEEAQDMPMSDIKTMADGMDKGKLQPENVARADFECKTRVVFNANAKNNRTLSSFPYGCLALKELFATMFIRRLDVCVFAARIDDQDLYNRRVDTKHDPLVSTEDLRALIYYAWSLTPDRISIGEEATKAILEETKALSARFGHCDDIPLVCPTDFRKTLARAAVAWAVLDLSSVDDFETIEVKIDHVRSAAALFANLYSHPMCGLDQYSDLCRRRESLEDFPVLKQEIEKRLRPKEALTGDSPFAKFVYLFTRGMSYRKQDLVGLIGCSESWLANAMTYMETMHLIRPSNEQLVATPKFNRLMKRLQAEAPELCALIEASKDKTETEDSQSAQ